MEINSKDLRVFSDIGTPFAEHENEDGGISYQFTMSARNAVVTTFTGNGSLSLSIDGIITNYPNTKALLASSEFGDLHRWASNQVSALRDDICKDPIEVKGALSIKTDASRILKLNELDQYLSQETDTRLDVVIFDGPAGIGKTTQIKTLSYRRARTFSTLQHRLILHIESIGRVMQGMDDLIAGSLQRIRAKPTFDQLRVLVRHGLVTLAIDGFDEMTDPSGYQLAWGQLRDLLEDSSGCGQIILSGRETFVSMERMIDALPILTNPDVKVSQYRLLDVENHEANSWLLRQGVETKILNDPRVIGLFTDDSYALRPFFLSALVHSDILLSLEGSSGPDLLSILIDSLILREQGKYGDDIAKAVTRETLGTYIRLVCEEVARDMADNQSEVIPAQNIEWASELCIPDGMKIDYAKTLIHRSKSLPFFTIDKGRNSIRFSHRQFYVFFLGSNAIKSLSAREIPKYLRRNVLGTEFLEAFPKVLLSLPNDIASQYIDIAIDLIPGLSYMNQSKGNVAALLLTSLCQYWPLHTIKLNNISIDEVYLSGILPPIELTNITLTMIRADNADLRNMSFVDDCHIVSMNSKGIIYYPSSFPTPSWLVDEKSVLRSESDIVSRIHGNIDGKENNNQGFPFDIKLLNRIRRYRSFWLRDDPEYVEPAGQHIIDHPQWEEALAWLQEHDLVRMEQRYPASGRSARFIHFKL